MSISISRADFYSLYTKNAKSERCKQILDFVLKKYNFTNVEEDCEHEMVKRIRVLLSNFEKLFNSCGRKTERLLKNDFTLIFSDNNNFLI